MNIESKNYFIKGLKLSRETLETLSNDLDRKKFQGYLILLINGASGFEESIILFEKGKPVACNYELISLKKQLTGDNAVDLIINAFSSKNGIIDAFETTDEELTVFFNNYTFWRMSDSFSSKLKRKLSNPPKDFSNKYLSDLGHVEENPRFEVMRKLGLDDIESK